MGLSWWVPQGPLTLFPSSPTPDDSMMNVNLQLHQLWSSKIEEKLKILVRFGYFAPFRLLYGPLKDPSRAPVVRLAVFHVLWLIIFQTRPITSLFSNPFRVYKKNKVNYQIIYSTGIKELVIRREAISLQLQGYEIWNFSVVCTYSTPTPHKGLELFRAFFVFGCQKFFIS